MKQMRTINFCKKDGLRTTVTLSEIQVDLADRLAEFYGISRSKMLSDIANEVRGNVNLSNAIRDWMYVKLVELLALKGVEL